MRNKKFVISADSLNSGLVIVTDTVLNLTQNSSSGLSETMSYFPKKVQLINRTGQDLGINIISSDDEYKAYQEDSTNYDLFTVLNNTSVVMSSVNILPTTYKILTQVLSGVVSSNFEIECICYQPRI